MRKEELLNYEAPTITEFVSWNWLQNIIAKYMGWKINRKWRRYQFRLKRDEFFKSFVENEERL